jgi:hypothetical protein
MRDSTRPARCDSFAAMMRMLAIVLLLPILGVGCGESSTKPAALATCSEPGVQCQLPEGPLGVCEQSHCRPDEKPPCYRCIPQH